MNHRMTGAAESIRAERSRRTEKGAAFSTWSSDSLGRFSPMVPLEATPCCRTSRSGLRTKLTSWTHW
jgi:hypothetical protein